MPDRPDRLTPRTAIPRGPDGERPIRLGSFPNEVLDEGGGDTAATDIDTNVGGAPATAGLDSGGAVGVRRGRAVGRPGAEYEDSERGETTSDVPLDAATVPDQLENEELEPDQEDVLAGRLYGESEAGRPE